MFPRPFLLLLFLTLSALVRAEPLPPEYAEVLAAFRADGSKGWAFTQSTTASKQSLVEAFDPSKPDMRRWTLLKKDGKDPTEDELQDYREKQTRRSRGNSAPDVTKQLDQASAEKISEDADRVVYRFRLNQGADDDTTAEHLRSTFTFHKATRSIERVELANLEPFSPMFSVKIKEVRTVMQYSLPTDDRPSLLERISVRVRGRAMLVKSLDEDMEVVYSDYRYAGRKPRPSPAPTAAPEPTPAP